MIEFNRERPFMRLPAFPSRIEIGNLAETGGVPHNHAAVVIDDFLILVPNKEIANNTFAKAQRMLEGLGMRA